MSTSLCASRSRKTGRREEERNPFPWRMRNGEQSCAPSERGQRKVLCPALRSSGEELTCKRTVSRFIAFAHLHRVACILKIQLRPEFRCRWISRRRRRSHRFARWKSSETMARRSASTSARRWRPRAVATAQRTLGTEKREIFCSKSISHSRICRADRKQCGVRRTL